jgi:hypothetical protein
VAPIRGLVLAFGLFAAAFTLHIAGGATDQGWLFAIAVALIYVTATAFPVLALVLAGSVSPLGRAITLNAGLLLGMLFTGGALWAANGRAFAWWTAPGAILLVFAVSSSLRLVFARRLAATTRGA